MDQGSARGSVIQEAFAPEAAGQASHAVALALARLRRRVLLRGALRWFWMASLTFDFGLLFCAWLSPAWYAGYSRVEMTAFMLLYPALVAAARAASIRLSPGEIARLADYRAGLAEQVSTAHEWGMTREPGKDSESVFAQLLSARAAQALIRAQERIVVPLQREAVYALIAALLSISLCLWRSPQLISWALAAGHTASSPLGSLMSQEEQPMRVIGPQVKQEAQANGYNPQPTPPEESPEGAAGQQSQGPKSNAESRSSSAKNGQNGASTQQGGAGSSSSGANRSSSSPAGAGAQETSSGGADQTGGGSSPASTTPGNGASPGEHQTGHKGAGHSGGNGPGGHGGNRHGNGPHSAGGANSSQSGAQHSRQGSTQGSGPGQSRAQNNNGADAQQGQGGAASGGSGQSSALPSGPRQGAQSHGMNQQGQGQGPGPQSSGPRNLPNIPNKSSFGFRIPGSNAHRANSAVLYGRGKATGEGAAKTTPASGFAPGIASPGSVQAVEQDPSIPAGYRQLVRRYFQATGQTATQSSRSGRSGQ